jgi:hypothetical protein
MRIIGYILTTPGGGVPKEQQIMYDYSNTEMQKKKKNVN